MRAPPLGLCLLAYGAASVLHFVHNGVFLHEYPNMPPSLSTAGVYVAWCVVTLVGLIGYGLYRYKFQRAGMLVIVLYALLGFGGLDHYTLAPVSAHSAMMNITIAVEVASASCVLILALVLLWRQRQLRLKQRYVGCSDLRL